MNPHRRILLLCPVVSLFLGATWGQSVQRDGRIDRVVEPIDPDRSSLTIVLDDGVFNHSITNGFDATVPTGIADVGGMAVLDAAQLSAVVAGRSGNHGYLVLVRRQGSALQATSLYTEQGADFAGVGHSATLNRLYVYDAVGARVLWAPYVKNQASIAPTQWTTLASAATTPELGHLGVRKTCHIELEDSPQPTLVLATSDWWEQIPRVTIRDTTGGPVVAVSMPAPSPPDLKISSHLSPATTSVQVTGPNGAQVEIARADASGDPLVGSGAIGPNGVGTITTTPLIWGADVQVTDTALGCIALPAG